MVYVSIYLGYSPKDYPTFPFEYKAEVSRNLIETKQKRKTYLGTRVYRSNKVLFVYSLPLTIIKSNLLLLMAEILHQFDR